MSKKEQEQLLSQLKKELEETEAERKFMQSQTGHHISRELRDKYASDVILLRKRVKELEATLSLNNNP